MKKGAPRFGAPVLWRESDLRVRDRQKAPGGWRSPKCWRTLPALEHAKRLGLR